MSRESLTLAFPAGWGRGEVVEELLRAGADPTKPDKFGKNAFDAADAAGDVSEQMRELLQRAVAS